MTRRPLVPIVFAAILSCSGCRRYCETDDDIRLLTMSEVVNADYIAIGRLDRRIEPPFPLFGDPCRGAKLIFSEVSALKGQVPTSITIQLPKRRYVPSSKGAVYLDEELQPGQWRILFLTSREGKLDSIAEDRLLSLPAASKFIPSHVSSDLTLEESLARILLLPASSETAADFGAHLSRIPGQLVQPLVGKARTVEMLEKLIGNSDASIGARACEMLLSMTYSPHDCTLRFPQDVEIARFLAMMKGPFKLLDKKTVKKIQEESRRDCESETPPVAYLPSIDRRQDCERYSRLVAAAVSRLRTAPGALPGGGKIKSGPAGKK